MNYFFFLLLSIGKKNNQDNKVLNEDHMKVLVRISMYRILVYLILNFCILGTLLKYCVY